MTAPTKFSQAPDAQRYDAEIRRLVPGYTQLHELTPHVLQALLPQEHGRLLFVGAGLCHEVVTLARLLPHWQIDALDASAAMLDAGKLVLAAAGALPNVTLYHARLGPPVDGAPHFLAHRADTTQTNNADTHAGNYDAVICLLVGHFIADGADRLQFMRDMADCLRPQGFLLLAEFVDDTHLREPLIQAHLAWSASTGLPTARVPLLQQRLRHDFSALTTTRLCELSTSVGLMLHGSYFRCLSVVGFILQDQ